MAENKILAGAAKSASYNMFLQLLFRLITFGLNAIILRYISRDLLGVVNVRLTLLYTTVLFVAREAFRRACLSRSSKESNWTQVINLLWLVVPISVLFSLVFGYIWAYLLEQPSEDTVPYYKFGVLCFALSSVIECLAEPLWVIGQVFLYVRLRVLIDSIALTLRCVLTAVFVIIAPQYGLLIFSTLQLLYVVVYLVLQYGSFVYLIRYTDTPENFPFKSPRDFFPKAEIGKPMIDLYSSTLVWSFFKQSFLKQLLTEGERYVMTMFDILSFSDQGVYDVINNLGSLVARFIFLPMEDSSYLFFSQTLARGKPAREQDKESIELSSKVLRMLLKTVTVIGITTCVYGYAYSYLLLDIYGGSVLSSGTGPGLLRTYCFYVLLLAINGITECFSFATMHKDEVDRYNHKMLLFSVLFLTSSLVLTNQIGSRGFIIANCLNMLARIAHSVYHTGRFYHDSEYSGLKGTFLKTPVLVLYSLAFVTIAASETIFCCDQGIQKKLIHVIIGGLCLLCNLGAVYLFEKDTIKFVIDIYRQKATKLSDKKKS